MSSGGTIPMFEEKPLLFLMDGHALVHRAWHAIQQPLNVSTTGEEVRAVFGFLNTFLRTLSDWKPTHCAIAFDLPAPTFRHRQFKDYKAQRPPTPPELRDQFDRIKQLVGAFGIPMFENEGYEADDILGTLGRQAEEQKIEALILTGDTDTLQLVSPWVRVLLSYSIQKKTVYDEAAVKERYGGLGPEVLPDVKALQGDTSDNIPGVPGVGAKTAIRLVGEFGSLEGLYEHLDQVSQVKLQQNLRDNRDLAFQAKALTTIVRDVPVQLDLEDARFWTYDRARVVELLKELEFFSMVSRIPYTTESADSEKPDEAAASERLETHYRVVDSENILDELVEELTSAGAFAFDTETTSKNAMDAELVGLSFSTAAGRGWYVPVGHLEGKQMPLALVLERIGPLLEGEEIAKAAHNANYDMTVLTKYGVQVRNMAFDTMLAAHVSGRKAIGLKALALECFNEEMVPITDLIGTGRKQITMAQVPVDGAADYAAADADFTQRLLDVLDKELDAKGVRELFDGVEMPLVPVLVRMQRNGVALNFALLNQMSEELGDRLSRIEADMYELVGHQFNLNSSQQLSDVLFKELRLPPTKRTQKGFSTDASSLTWLKALLDRGEAEDVGPQGLPDPGPGPGIPAAIQNQVHIRGRATRASQPQDRSDPHQLQPDGLGHRQGIQQRPQRAEHTGEDGAGPQGAEGIRRREGAGVDLAGRRLLPDRATHSGPRVPGLRAPGGLPQQRGHSRGHRVVGLRRPHGRGHGGHEAHRQDNELRRALRPQRLWHQPADGPGARRGGQIHRDLLRQVPRHPDLHRLDQGQGQGDRLRGDPARAQAIHPRDPLQQPQRPGRR